jgi:hypothetical protein
MNVAFERCDKMTELSELHKDTGGISLGNVRARARAHLACIARGARTIGSRENPETLTTGKRRARAPDAVVQAH